MTNHFMYLEENFMQYVEIDSYEGIHLTRNVFVWVATMSYELKYEYRFISYCCEERGKKIGRW